MALRRTNGPASFSRLWMPQRLRKLPAQLRSEVSHAHCGRLYRQGGPDKTPGSPARAQRGTASSVPCKARMRRRWPCGFAGRGAAIREATV